MLFILRKILIESLAPPTPTMADLLGEDETVINPFYMKQLLEYGIRLGQDPKGKEATQEFLEEDAQVSHLTYVWHQNRSNSFSLATGKRAALSCC